MNESSLSSYNSGNDDFESESHVESSVLISNQNVEGAKQLFAQIHFFLVILMWIPIFIMRNPKVTTTISWTGMLISVCYQIFHLWFNICESVKKFPIPGIDNTTGRTAETVYNEKVYEMTQLPASFSYLFIRLVVYIMLWLRRNDMREIFTLICYSISTDKYSMQNLSKSISRICPILYLYIFLIISVYIAMFYCVNHNFTWLYLVSRIYTSVMVTCILTVYYFMIHGYQIMFKSFFINIYYNNIGVTSIRTKLNNIKTTHLIIERKFGFFIFWIFCLNYIEIVWTVLIVPHLSQFDLSNLDDFLWVMSIFRSLINLTTIFIIMVKVDTQKWSTDKFFRNFERGMVGHSTETNITLLVMDIKDTVDLRFTAWLGFIPINRSVLISYLVNLIVYSNLLFGLIRWLMS